MHSLTYRQRCLAYLARLYYIWSFDVVPVYETAPLTVSQRVLASKADGMSILLWQVINARKHWHSGAARLLGKLKVLLSPIKGW